MEADKDTDVSLKGGDILEVGITRYSIHFHQQPSHTVQITFSFMDKILKVSPRSGGEVLDLNPKPVETFYPSPRKAARATR